MKRRHAHLVLPWLPATRDHAVILSLKAIPLLPMLIVIVNLSMDPGAINLMAITVVWLLGRLPAGGH